MPSCMVGDNCTFRLQECYPKVKFRKFENVIVRVLMAPKCCDILMCDLENPFFIVNVNLPLKHSYLIYCTCEVPSRSSWLSWWSHVPVTWSWSRAVIACSRRDMLKCRHFFRSSELFTCTAHTFEARVYKLSILGPQPVRWSQVQVILLSDNQIHVRSFTVLKRCIFLCMFILFFTLFSF